MARHTDGNTPLTEPCEIVDGKVAVFDDAKHCGSPVVEVVNVKAQKKNGPSQMRGPVSVFMSIVSAYSYISTKTDPRIATEKVPIHRLDVRTGFCCVPHIHIFTISERHMIVKSCHC